MSRVSRLQRARTPPRRRSLAWLARQEARRWVWVLDRVEYDSGSCDCLDPWGRRTSYGWTAPRMVYYRWKRRTI
jgi:hypothetical protein